MIVLYTVFIIAASFGPVAAEDPTTSLPGVHDLTPSTFDDFVNGKTHALVEFYAPWCGHCKSLTPEYKKLGEKISTDPKFKGRVIIAKVNADEHRELGTKFAVSGFPTLKWFGRGQPVTTPEDYHGGRTLAQFLKFIEDKLEADTGFGRVDVLDAIVQSFIKGDKDTVIKEVEAKTSELGDEDKEKAAVYLKIMKKAKEKGDAYFSNERARLERLIDSGNVNQEKLIEISRKISIISAFDTEQ